ncbi:hypothetical protein [Calothrix sp. NIES-2100]
MVSMRFISVVEIAVNLQYVDPQLPDTQVQLDVAKMANYKYF